MNELNKTYSQMIKEAKKLKPLKIKMFAVESDGELVTDDGTMPVLSDNKIKLSGEIDGGENVISVEVTIKPI